MGTYVTNTGLMATYGGQFTLTLFKSFLLFVHFRMPRDRVMSAFQASFMGITQGYAGKYHGLIWVTARIFMGNATSWYGKRPWFKFVFYDCG
ncbi:hypothetical protein DOP95_25750 [Escherichia coli]|nr:hypothetical protein [Escherichia coli]